MTKKLFIVVILLLGSIPTNAQITRTEPDSIPFVYGGCYSLGCYLPVPSLVSADLDRDGDQDIAAICPGGDRVVIMRNSGNGVFSIAGTYDIGGSCTALVTADFDLDGDKDIFVTRQPSSNSYVNILLNNSDGTFVLGAQIPLNGLASGIFAAKLNSDAYPDLAITTFTGFAILKNSGYGSFLAPVYYGVSYTQGISGADLDGDGDIDLAVTNRVAGKILIFKNYGDGSFYSEFPGYYWVGGRANAVCLADLDGDGDQDVITGNTGYPPNSYGSISVLKNNGNGTFQSSVNYGFQSIESVFAADFDKDGDIDVAGIDYWYNCVVILRNTGDGTFQDTTLYYADCGANAKALFGADLDNDQDVDLIVGKQAPDILIMNNLTTGVPPVVVEYLGEHYIKGDNNNRVKDEADKKITCGDHVKLSLPLKNKGIVEAKNVTVRITQWHPPNSCLVGVPTLWFSSNGSGPYNIQCDLPLGDLAPDQMINAEFYVYLENLDPSGRYGVPAGVSPSISMTIGCQGSYRTERISLITEEIKVRRYDLNSSDYGSTDQMLKEDCLRNSFSVNKVKCWANYMAGNPTPGAISDDPDLPTLILRNVNSKFAPSWHGPGCAAGCGLTYARHNTLEAIDRIEKGKDLGECADFMDLSAAFLRVLGFQTRDMFGHFKITGDWSYRGLFHNWNEVCDPNSANNPTWIHFDSFWRYVNTPTVYDAEYDIVRVHGAKRALISAKRATYTAIVCDPFCVIGNCLLCSRVGASTVPQCLFSDDVTSRYIIGKESGDSRNISQETVESLIVDIQGPHIVIKDSTFTAKVILENMSSESISDIRVSVGSHLFAGDSLVYECQAPSVVIDSISSMKTDTIAFQVIPRATARYYTLPVFIWKDSTFISGDLLEQSILSSEEVPPLHVQATTNSESVQPNSTVEFRVEVYDTAFIGFSSATVTGTLYSSVDSSFQIPVMFTYDWTDSVYVASVNLPTNCPVGSYILEGTASYPAFEPDSFLFGFSVSPVLSITARSDTSSYLIYDSVTIEAELSDRGSPVPYTSVIAEILAPYFSPTPETVYLVLSYDSLTSTYKTEFRPVDLVYDFGDSVAPLGVWHVKVSADYYGITVEDEFEFAVYETTMVNHSPNQFSLLWPQNRDTVHTFTPLLDWETAMDPDPGDNVLYALYYGPDPLFSPESTTVVEWLLDSQYQIPRPKGFGGSDFLGDTSVVYWKVKATDSYGAQTWCNEIDWSFTMTFLHGDANGDGAINLGDVVYLISYLYRGGPAPYPLAAGDATCNGLVNLGDVVFLINYLFKSGPPPSC